VRAVAGQLEAEPDEVSERAQVHFAGDDGRAGGVAVQPGTAVTAGAVTSLCHVCPSGRNGVHEPLFAQGGYHAPNHVVRHTFSPWDYSLARPLAICDRPGWLLHVLTASLDSAPS
jgi:hypothetical protein